MQGLTIAAAVRNAAEAFSTKPAVIDGDETVSFAALDQRADAIAAGLDALGVRAGERVALLFRNEWRMLASYIAVVRLGCVVVPLNNRLVAGEIAFQVTDSACAALICGHEFRPLAEAFTGTPIRVWVVSGDIEAGGQWHRLDELMAPGPDVPAVPRHVERPEDVSGVWYTSGTTGAPKGAVVTHASSLSAAVSISVTTGFGRDSVVLAAAPLFHRGPAESLHLAALIVGATQVMMRGFEPCEMLRLIETHHVTHAFIVPTMSWAVLNLENRGQYDLTSMRCWMSASAPLPPGYRARLHLETTLPAGTVYNAYGLTESLLNTCLTPDEADERPTSAGRPCLGTSVHIVDSERRVVPVGTVGEVAVSSTSMASDYLGRSDEWDATTFSDGERTWYRTGDLGYLDSMGYLFLVDRAKDMVLSGGENVYSAEVEQILVDHPGVREVAVVGTPDERWGEAVTAVVVLAEGWTVPSLDLASFCEGRLASYKRPRKVIAVDALPRNSFGKVQKSRLRDQLQRGDAA